MKSILILLTLAIGFLGLPVIAQQESHCANEIGTCQYYQCKEQEFQCGDSGYLLQYGYRFCQKFFNELDEKLSAEGSLWIQNAASCLQEKIENESSNMNCKQLKKFAYSSHSSCYSEASFCQIPLEDKYKIIRFLKSELHKFQTQKEGIQVLFNCFQSR